MPRFTCHTSLLPMSSEITVLAASLTNVTGEPYKALTALAAAIDRHVRPYIAAEYVERAWFDIVEFSGHIDPWNQQCVRAEYVVPERVGAIAKRLFHARSHVTLKRLEAAEAMSAALTDSSLVPSVVSYRTAEGTWITPPSRARRPYRLIADEAELAGMR